MDTLHLSDTPAKRLALAERELAQAKAQQPYDLGWVVECKKRVARAKEEAAAARKPGKARLTPAQKRYLDRFRYGDGFVASEEDPTIVCLLALDLIAFTPTAHGAGCVRRERRTG